ncbi:MAG: hypothetical protein KF791_04795 [Verrucomicrobiae bacterium]|nr:hypothetical protein [Verrucomicrobiae bacterium]
MLPVAMRQILQPGEKIHLIQRRNFEHEPHRHFVGEVEAYENGLIRATGWVFAVDQMTFQFVRRPEPRTRIVSASSGEVLINVIPPAVDLSRVTYQHEAGGLRVSDGSAWHLDISEVAWR